MAIMLLDQLELLLAQIKEIDRQIKQFVDAYRPAKI
jgi:hypothetical protein